MTEGTKSWILGCHSVVHTYYVVKAWRHLYNCWPTFWQLVCILIHDIGYCGMSYLTAKSNSGHAERGGYLAGFLFGDKGFEFVIGHSRSSSARWNLQLSALELADDYSWLLASDWWLDFNKLVEPQLDGREWKNIVKKNWELGVENRRAGFELTRESLARKEEQNGHLPNDPNCGT